MAQHRKTVGRRRPRAVRLRSETTSAETLDAMAQQLGSELALEPERAREILLRLGRSKYSAA